MRRLGLELIGVLEVEQVLETRRRLLRLLELGVPGLELVVLSLELGERFLVGGQVCEYVRQPLKG